MASIYLQSVSQEQFLQSGGIGSPPSLQLRTDSSANINLYPADYGIKSTITNYNSTDLKLFPVSDDTPPIVSPLLPAILITLQPVTSPTVIQIGSLATPPTLQLYTGAITPADIWLESVSGGVASTRSSVNIVDLKLYPVGSSAPSVQSVSIVESISAIDTEDSISTQISSIVEGVSVLDTEDSTTQALSSIIEGSSASDLEDSTNLQQSSILETGVISDVPDAIYIGIASDTETISGIDNPDAINIGVSEIIELITVTDDPTATQNTLTSITEDGAILDNNSANLITNSSVNESGNVIDGLSTIGNLLASQTESILASDNETGRLLTLSDISENTNVVDSLNGYRFVPIIINEVGTALDFTSAIFTGIASISELTQAMAGASKMYRWNGTAWMPVNIFTVFK